MTCKNLCPYTLRGCSLYFTEGGFSTQANLVRDKAHENTYFTEISVTLSTP